MKTINDGGPVILLLETGQECIISSEDFERVASCKWRLGSNDYIYKVGGRKKGVTCLLHRFIMNADKNKQVHHLNHNKLDNQRSNLEIINPSLHQKKYHSSSTSERNKKNRIYPMVRSCLGCGQDFVVHPDHRGRNKYCSRDCGNKNRYKIADAMIEARKEGK
jgi:hypothetical protein